MKKLFVLISILFFISPVFAQEATLDPAATLNSPTAAKISITSINIRLSDRRIVVHFRWIDSNGNPIYTQDSNGQVDSVWVGRNNLGEPVANCTAENDPYSCCTGSGTGEGCQAPDLVFNEIFNFQIRQQDVGNTLGKGMRTLIINQMKKDIPALKNITVSFSD